MGGEMTIKKNGNRWYITQIIQNKSEKYVGNPLQLIWATLINEKKIQSII